MPPANLRKRLAHWKQHVISIVLLSEMKIKPCGDDLQAWLWFPLHLRGPAEYRRNPSRP